MPCTMAGSGLASTGAHIAASTTDISMPAGMFHLGVVVAVTRTNAPVNTSKRRL